MSRLNGVVACVVALAIVFLHPGRSADAAVIDVPGQFATIQAAINASVNGDEIVVHPGTYNELIRFNGKAVTLRSAKGAGTAIIDGGSLGTTVKFVTAETAASVLDGFTIRSGRAAVGGGMYINSASPTIRNCVFTGNTALDRGGAAAIVNGKPSFTACAFNSNTATERGGAAYLMVNSDVVWTNCVFTSNRAMNRSGDSYGGAIAAESESDQTFTGCTFTSNKAEPDAGYNGGAGGGAVWLNGPMASFAGCTFTANTASPRSTDGHGGAIYSAAAAPEITSCVFQGNAVEQLGSSSNTGFGGAIRVPAAIVCTDSTFANNQVRGFFTVYGGAIYSGGDVECRGCDFTRCLVSTPVSSSCSPRYANGGAIAASNNALCTECTFSACAINGGYDSCSDSGISSGGAVFTAGITSCDSCTFVGCEINNTNSNTSIQALGGAIKCSRIGTLTQCVFDSNRCFASRTPRGGAIYCDAGNSSDSMTGVDFVGNRVESYGGNAAEGGALWGYAFGPFTGCEFRSNTASGGTSYGGAIRCDGGNWNNCVFAANTAITPAGTAEGGAVRMYGEGYTSQASFTDCSFSNNNTDGNSTRGGAIYRFGYALNCASCVFTGNSAQQGGAAYLQTNSNYNYPNSFTNCRFEKNTGAQGAALWLYGLRRLQLTDSIFNLNLAFDAGGAVWLAGYSMYSTQAARNTFVGNIANNGGALYFSNYGGCWQFPMDNCLFAANTATIGGGISNSNGSCVYPAVSNSTFCGNSPSNIEGYWQNNGNNIFGAGTDCNNNGVCDGADIGLGTSSDCNSNGVPDECEIADGTQHDIDSNGVLDVCQPDCDHDGIPDAYALANNLVADCNHNNLPDPCDIANGTSADLNHDGVPDSCQVDCNGNGVPDDFDISSGFSTDCNANGVPDSCDIGAGGIPDCNANGLPDACDIASGFSSDVNTNGIPDSCEVDCNGNGVPDRYDIATGAAQDCNANGVPDSCDIASGGANDVDHNGVPDSCQPDCNSNGVPDSYELVTGTAPDCNSNGVIDSCDIAAGAADINQNGVPDTCECIFDITGDGVVAANDLGALLAFWGPVTTLPRADINADGFIGAEDLALVLSNWGPCN